MRTLTTEEKNKAIEATRTLYHLGLIDVFIYEALIAKIVGK